MHEQAIAGLDRADEVDRNQFRATVVGATWCGWLLDSLGCVGRQSGS